jgi:phosphate transport system protein
LKLEVEAMALKVEETLELSAEVVRTGDVDLAEKIVARDDAIDAHLVSVTERCYELLVRQSPVASDLRLIVSVLRIVVDLERTGDLCLRIVKLAPDHDLLARDAKTFAILQDMAEEAKKLFRLAVTAWSTQDLRLAISLEQRDDVMDVHNSRLMTAILDFEGSLAVAQAVKTQSAGRALERIADHCVMIGERLRYMLTGDILSLSKEIGP